MISYYGLPLTWPGGKIFGTICILDKQENSYSQLIRDLLTRFRDSVQFSLDRIYDAYVERQAKGGLEAANIELRRLREHLEELVGERTAALRQASEYNRTLIEASLDPLVTIGPDGKITDVNAALVQATGVAREQLIGTDFSDYFTEPERARAGYLQVFRENAVHDYPLELRRRDGQVMPVIYNASLYRDEMGKGIGIFAAARDVTERKQVEEALVRRADELAQFNAAAVGRELRMVELKEEVNELARQLNQPPPYQMDSLNEAVPASAPGAESGITGNPKSETSNPGGDA
jgi:PAS domain S-box-containing protein